MLTQLETGAIFASDFRIHRQLGRGGMGFVYEATQLSTGRRRALKVMAPQLVEDDTLRKRFAQEARIGAMIESDHIVDVVASGVDDTTGIPWLAMELLVGENLEARVRSRGPMSFADVNRILAQVCHALDAAHRRGIVHRDLKPENIFLHRAKVSGSAAEQVKILDFGIAKVRSEWSLTGKGAIGTPTWWAPEQVTGEATPATDVWALGLVAFWLVTGASYWRSVASGEAIATELLDEVLNRPLARASERAREVGSTVVLPPGFDPWFASCVAREPSRRYEDAGIAYRDLDVLLRAPDASHDIAFGSTAPATKRRIAMPARQPVSQRSRVPRSVLLIGVASIAASALGAAYLAWPTTRRPSTTSTVRSAAPPGGEAPIATASALPPAQRNQDEPVAGVEASEIAGAHASAAPSSGNAAPRASAASPKSKVTNAPEVLEPGFLTVVCNPFCEATLVDGKDLGPTPVLRVPLSPGKHTVVLRGSAGPPKAVPVEIVSGQALPLRVSME